MQFLKNLFGSAKLDGAALAVGLLFALDPKDQVGAA